MVQTHPFRYLATFRDLKRAEQEFATVSAIHRGSQLGMDGAALLTRDRSGEVWLSTRERSAEYGAALGALLGALTGRLLHLSPPVGGLAGGVAGYLRAGRPSREVRALAATLSPGESAVVVVGKTRLGEALRQAGARCVRSTGGTRLRFTEQAPDASPITLQEASCRTL